MITTNKQELNIETLYKKTLNKNILITSLILVISMLLFEISDLDLIIQDLFYDFDMHAWIVDRDNMILKFIFYDGIKKALILFALTILIMLLFYKKNEHVQHYKTGLVIVVLSAVFVPSVVGGLKAITNTPCPKALSHFNGCYPYIKVFTPYPPTFHQKEKVECFPAGHASGGFALLSLFFLFKSKKNRRRALLFAIATGWGMGIYKMLIGDHFFSHTFIAMVLAWLIILIVAKFTLTASHDLNY